MCTSLSLPTAEGRILFGRTLDLDAHFGEAVTLTPRRYPFCFRDCYPLTRHYALLGMAAVAEGYPLYAEAMNEKGLCMAGLRFAESAAYASHPQAGRLNLAPWELIPYLLGTCSTVAEAREALEGICVVDRPFSDQVGTAPLHWHMVDADSSHDGLILEVTGEGMRLYAAKEGVLTNEPPYPDQLDGMTAWPSLRGDAIGLPGDYSSPSRFIRAATLRRWWMEQGSTCCSTVEGDLALAQFFSVLGAVSPTAGAVLTPEGGCHRTLYTCCMDTAAGRYHYRTEGTVTVSSVGFEGLDLNGDAAQTVEG